MKALNRKLRHRITIQSLQTGSDDWGQPAQTWIVVLAAEPADVRHLSGLETISAEAEISVTRTSIRIRHRDGIVPAMRVLHDGAIYDIKAVLPDCKRQFIDLACERVT